MTDTSGIPATMRAVRLLGAGGAADIAVEEIDTPRPLEGEALVRVPAAAITRDELTWPTDRLPATPSYEMAGEVVAVAPGVETVAVGDAVFALTPFDRNGAAADYMAVPVNLLAPSPSSIDDVSRAALPMGALSAWQGLFDHGHLETGQRVLVTGTHGGVGHLATQIARSQGAQVIDGEGGEPADLVFDTVGGDVLLRSPSLVRQGGRIVSIAEEPHEIPEGAQIETVYFVVESNRGQLLEVARLVDAGEVRPEIDSVFPLAEARDAFERTEQRGKHGKVVLRVTGGEAP